MEIVSLVKPRERTVYRNLYNRRDEKSVCLLTHQQKETKKNVCRHFIKKCQSQNSLTTMVSVYEMEQINNAKFKLTDISFMVMVKSLVSSMYIN